MPGGIFWTVNLAKELATANLSSFSVQANPGAGEATYQVKDLKTKDFSTTLNDLLHGPSIPATVSFTVQWSGMTSNTQLSHLNPGNLGGLGETNGGKPFAGEFVVSKLPGHGTATMTWSASEAGLHFISDPSTPAQCLWTVVGQERNGVFLP